MKRARSALPYRREARRLAADERQNLRTTLSVDEVPPRLRGVHVARNHVNAGRRGRTPHV